MAGKDMLGHKWSSDNWFGLVMSGKFMLLQVSSS